MKTYKIYLQDKDNVAEVKATDYKFEGDGLYFYNELDRIIAVFNMNNIKGFKEV